jgi:hypothetical protein
MKKLYFLFSIFFLFPNVSNAKTDALILGYVMCVDGYISAGAVDFFQRNGEVPSKENLVSVAMEVCQKKKNAAIRSISKDMRERDQRMSDGEINKMMDEVFLSDFQDTALKITRVLKLHLARLAKTCGSSSPVVE